MRIILLMVLSTLLMACTSQPIPRQPEIQVEVVTHSFAMTLQGKTLKQVDIDSLHDFFVKQGKPGNLRVRITTHSSRGDTVKAQLKAKLKQWQIYQSQIENARDFTIDTSADFTISVEYYRSLVRECYAGKASATVLNNFKRSANFGCANASALAQMIADPRDLVVGEQLGAMEGRKAIATLDAYYNQPTQPLNQSSPISGSLSGSGGQ